MMGDPVFYRREPGDHERPGRIVGRCLSVPPSYDVEDEETGERTQNLPFPENVRLDPGKPEWIEQNGRRVFAAC